MTINYLYIFKDAISCFRGGIFSLKVSAIIVASFLISSVAFAQDKDSIEGSKRSVIVVPIGFYQPETSVGLGAAGGYYYKSNDLNKISSVSYSAIYTFKNQFIFHVAPKLYSKNKKYYYYSDLGVNYYPDVFYGVGNKDVTEGLDYTTRYVKLSFQPQRYINKSWSVGLNYFLRYEEADLSEVLVAGGFSLLDGATPFFVQALGFVSTYDIRDNHFYPEKGFFAKFSSWFSSKSFGSDYLSNYYNLDIRHYLPLGKKHIFASQFYSSLVTGDAPFQFLQTIGGRDRMRGFREGMFMNNASLIWQSEYRFPIYKRLKAAAFGGVAQIFDYLNYKEDKLKLSYGVGLRYRLNDARVHLRLDYGLSNYGTQGLYITASEAF